MGCDIGFAELLRAGQISAAPRLFCAQPLACSPICTAFNAAGGLSDSKQPPPAWNEPTSTMAEGTSIARPVRLQETCDALRRSGGGAVRVTEEDIAAATLELARKGLYVEPTCAQAAAAYHELLASGAISTDQLTVVVLTGTGVKATPCIAGILGVAL